MDIKIVFLFCLALLIRFLSFLISIKNEKLLKLDGAVEYGKVNTVLILISHSSFYLFSFIDGYMKKINYDYITVIGIILLIFSSISLAIVIHELGRFWTFKLYIAKSHILNQSFIFKYFRHPNYFFNVIPELLSIVFIFKAWLVLSVLFPFHMILLAIRIKQENTVMKFKFSGY